MPVISRFYGIVVKMYFNDHLPPHFHAIYGEFIGVISISNGELIEGDLPSRAYILVREWAGKHSKELLQMWKNKKFKQIPGLK